MAKRKKPLKLQDTYSYPEFRPKATLQGIAGVKKQGHTLIAFFTVTFQGNSTVG